MSMHRNKGEEALFEELRTCGQEHVLRFWPDLDEAGKDTLVSDIRSLDFDLIRRVQSLLRSGDIRKRTVFPPPVIPLAVDSKARAQAEEAEAAGEGLIAGGKTAVFTAAGGQSSRLGLKGPKGVYPVTPVRKKSLFQVHAEKILGLQKRYGVSIPWMIMTSRTNHGQTLRYFEENGYFGLEPGFVRFIEQSMNPAFDNEGRLFLREKNGLFMSPNGHGGTMQALGSPRISAWLGEIGVEQVFYFQVDNVLVNVLDPLFMGYHALENCDMSSKYVRIREAGEKLGIFVLEDGKMAVVEYTELDTMNIPEPHRREDLFAGNIAIHAISRAFAGKMARAGELPLHLARKAIPHVDENGMVARPAAQNGYKVETFIFDALLKVRNTVLVETDRFAEFSPLKNKTGPESPETVYRDQVLLFAGWLDDAGIEVQRDGDGLPVHAIEVSPLYALDKNTFIRKTNRDTAIHGETYFG